jgi:succinyl-CoA synthetase beta subunit
MDVHEYQAKELLASFGVAVPRGTIAFTADQAVYAATELGGWHWAVKAQIHAGGRGKAGGIRLCKTYNEVQQAPAGGTRPFGKASGYRTNWSSWKAGPESLCRSRRPLRA